MITGDHDKLQGYAKMNLCAEHKTPLEVAWHSGKSCWALRCDENHYPNVVVRNTTVAEDCKQGKMEDAVLPEKIRQGKQAVAKRKPEGSVVRSFYDLPYTDLATGAALHYDTVKALITYAKRYNLDPYRGHVVVMHGKPYVGLDGYLYHANRSGRSYSLRSRPMTTEEIKLYKIGPTDHGWKAELTFLDTGAEFFGTGIVTYEEMTEKSKGDNTKLSSPVVAKYPWLLAQKRGEWQALRRAFPIGDTDLEQ